MIKMRDILTSDELKEFNALKVNKKGGIKVPKHILTKIKKATKGKPFKLSKDRTYLA